jgi:RNA polymerase II subunit A small phosphatase-like protein
MKRPLLILDLDETLIYSSEQALSIGHDFRCGQYNVYKRPFVGEFLETCARSYDMAVWTSATEDYARVIVPALFGELAIEFLWARERCTQRHDDTTREAYWVKDLKKVKRAGFELKRVLMVDDARRELERNYSNAVIVNPFEGNPADRELLHLAAYLARIAGAEDLQRLEKRDWRGARQQGPGIRPE